MLYSGDRIADITKARDAVTTGTAIEVPERIAQSPSNPAEVLDNIIKTIRSSISYQISTVSDDIRLHSAHAMS